MKSITLSFPGEPRAVQSVRFARIGSFIRKYQPKKNEDWKSYIRVSASSQLPAGFEMFCDCPIRARVHFIFSPLKSFCKADRLQIESGGLIRKWTKPDLMDNLAKGLCDALSGIVYADDAIIASGSTVKYYSRTPGIIITIEELNKYVWHEEL